MRMIPQQLALPLRRSTEGDVAVTRLPFPIAWRKVRRAVKRGLCGADPNAAMATYPVRVDQAVLDQVRQRARCAARAGGRKSKVRTVAYICKPEGRQVQRVIAALSERIAAQEARLCG